MKHIDKLRRAWADIPPSVEGTPALDPPKTRVDRLEKLYIALSKVPPGPTDVSSVTGPLADAWPWLDGSDVEGTYKSKVYRIEGPTWQPPVLSFSLERHGRLVQGSTRSALHFWEVNVEAATATIVRTTHRQTYAMAKRVDCGQLAKTVAKKIQRRSDSDELTWKRTGEVKVVLARIPELSEDVCRETRRKRRQRFRAELVDQLRAVGWRTTTDLTFKPPADQRKK